MKITFIRHSKTKFDPNVKVTNWELTPEGVKLAYELAQNPDIQKIEILYSSDQKKAIQTAEIINKILKKDHKIHPGLTELSSVTVKILDDFEKEVHKLYTGEAERLNGGESFKEALDRFENTLEEISKNEKHRKNVGIVTHGFILAIFTNKYRDKPIQVIHEKIQLPDYAIFDYKKHTFIKNFRNLLIN